MTKSAWIWLGLVLALASAGAAAQTYTVPMDSGTAPSGLTNSNIYQLNGNVGIGTANPAESLRIQTPAGTTTSTFGMSANGALPWADFTITRTDYQTGLGQVAFMEGYGGANFSWGHGAMSGGTVTAMQLGEIGVNGGHDLIINDESGTAQVTLVSNGNSFLNGGNVGIGTTNPGAALEVNGTGIKLTGGAGGVITFQDGTQQSTAFIPANCGADYAESVGVTGDRTKYEPGDLLVIDPDNPGRFLKSDQAYSTMVAGIYSTKPGFVGRKQPASDPVSANEVPMAMVGRVPAKVSAENGPVRVGDLLVTSSTMGYAMKGTDRSQMLGAVIGKALGSLDSGTGVIEVLVTLQ